MNKRPCRLKKVERPPGKFFYCGPIAVAAMLGKPVERVEKRLVLDKKKRLRTNAKLYRNPELVKKAARVKSIVGTSMNELRDCVLNLTGKRWTIRIFPTEAKGSIIDWVTGATSQVKEYRRGRTFLIGIPGHWVVYSDGEILDYSTWYEPVHFTKFARAHSKITNVGELARVGSRLSE